MVLLLVLEVLASRWRIKLLVGSVEFGIKEAAKIERPDETS